MKKIVASLLAVSLSAAVAYESSVKEYRQGNTWVRTVIHEDGSRTVSKKDESAREVVKLTYAAPTGGTGEFVDIVISESRFELNSNGDYVRGQVFDRKGNVVFISNFVYDQFNRLLEERVTDARGIPVRRIIYRYDQFTAKKNGRMTAMPRPFIIDFENGRATSGPRAVADADDYSTGSDRGFSLNRRSNSGSNSSARASDKDDDENDQRRFRLFRRNNDKDDDDSSSRRRGLFRRK